MPRLTDAEEAAWRMHIEETDRAMNFVLWGGFIIGTLLGLTIGAFLTRWIYA